ncbi:MAG: N-6 DNA methylase [Terriglobia bacterium]|jgi:methylase of polypeptide subunit release factors
MMQDSAVAPGFSPACAALKGGATYVALYNTSAKLKRELEELEQGGVFHTLGITNFLEGDLFSWYLGAWSAPVEKLVRAMVTKLDLYNPGTFSEDPAQSRDLLKKLYQQLFPKSVRHDLGEYYTPDWLAEHVLNELGYEGDPDKRLLDPACGSGTFMVMAINRIRRWYDLNREKCAYDEGDLLKKILTNVIGFDLNPLAVMAARTNYLVAVKDLIRHVDKVEIPVYLCDSIMTPAEYGDLFTDGQGKVAKVPCSAMKPPHLLVPKEIAKSPKEVAKYADVLEQCVKDGYAPNEFLSRCRDEGLNITATDAHIALYKELVKLDKANKNGIWARIIKNNFAPLFVGRVDYVAGNPPWVNWESLPAEYRDSLKPLWQEYGLFTLSGSAGRLGGGKKDLSMLFVYGGVDNYLADSGRLGFVITQSVFKTRGAGDGFRQLRFLRDKKKVVLKPIAVHDLSDMQVFEGATNRTAVFVCEKQRKDFSYPIPYVVWSGPSRIEQDDSLAVVLTHCNLKKLAAVPIDHTKESSPWLTLPGRALKGVQKATGQSAYKAYAGCCTWLNGAFWIEIIKKLPDGNLLIENLNAVGKIKLPRVETAVESALVYPLLRGRDVIRWRAEPSTNIVLTQDPDTRAGISEKQMKQKYERTYQYLKKFEDQLRKRSGYRQYFDSSDPFYSIYNVGPYTMKKWKVMWPEVGNTVRAGVCGPRRVDSEKPALPDHTIIAVSCEWGEEAHYVCAMLNSSPAQSAASGYIVLHPSPHIMEHIGIESFDPKNPTHRRLADLSKACHAATIKGDMEQIESLEAEIDKAAAKLWDITDNELKAIQEALAESGRGKRKAANDDDEE